MKALMVIFSVLLLSTSSFSQTLTNEGIAGHLDKQRRGPVLTVTASSTDGTGKILADAYVPYEELNKYPIRFEFYINGELRSSQLRSPELKRPVGLDVPASMAPIPFNYQVVATLLTPNRVYPTVIQGAVFENTLGGIIPCEITATVNGASKTFTNNAVTIAQNSGNTFDLSFEAESAEGEDYEVSGTLTTGTDSTVSGDLITNFDDISSTKTVTGSYEQSNGNVSSLTLVGDNLDISCELAEEN